MQNYWPLSDIDPAPGNPDGLRGYAAELRRCAEMLRHSAEQTRSRCSDSERAWIGQAARSFRTAGCSAAERSTTAARGFEEAAASVCEFAEKLSREQCELARSAERAQWARAAKLRATFQLDMLPPDDPRRPGLRHAIDQADHDYRSANSAFSAGVSRLDHASARCVRLLDQVGAGAAKTNRRPSKNVTTQPKPFGKAADAMRPLAGPLYPSGVPSANDVNQGGVGDCWLLSALAAMTQSEDGRRRLMNMIDANSDGTFAVGFADGKTVTVNGDLYVDKDGNPIYAKSGRDSWVQIIEKAYAARSSKGFDSIDGGWQTNALAVLGGYDTVRLDLNPSFAPDPSDADIATTIAAALNAGKPVTASARVKGGPHAFTVLSTVDGLVVVRNPWGSDQNATTFNSEVKGPLRLAGTTTDYLGEEQDGTIRIPIAEFTRGFDDLEYAL
jgi:uncharacterized protein YukE